MLEKIVLVVSVSLRGMICSFVTLLFLSSVTFAHDEEDQGHWRDELHAFQVHQIIEALYDIDEEDVHDDVNHDYNNFRNRPDTQCGYRGGHSGYDVTHEENKAEIFSLTDGEVIKVKMPRNPKVDLSYLAVYSHEYDETVFYLHLSYVEVEVGDEVERGDYIGDQGWNSKFSSEYHIHLEVRRGKSFSPSCGAGSGGNHRNFEPIHSIYETGFENIQVFGAPSLSSKPRVLTETWGSIKFND